MTAAESGKTVLDLCGGTGAWSQPYRDAGYDVRTITLPEWDVIDYAALAESNLEPGSIHGVLAAPPCDHFSVSGAQYWAKKDADGRTRAALDVVDACLDIILHVQPVFWALENPVGRLKDLRGHVLGPVKLTFDPCDYGDPYTKKTLLWGKFRPPLKLRKVEPVRVCLQGSWLQKLGGKSEKTKRLRSATPPGFARAFFDANP